MIAEKNYSIASNLTDSLFKIRTESIYYESINLLFKCMYIYMTFCALVYVEAI